MHGVCVGGCVCPLDRSAKRSSLRFQSGCNLVTMAGRTYLYDEGAKVSESMSSSAAKRPQFFIAEVRVCFRNCASVQTLSLLAFLMCALNTRLVTARYRC